MAADGRARGASARRAAATATLVSTGTGAGSAAAVGRTGACHVGSGGGELVAESDAHGEIEVRGRMKKNVQYMVSFY